MAEQKCSTVFFKCKSTSATTVAIEQHLNKNPNVSQLRIDTPEGVIECFSQAQHGLVIFEIHDKNELVDATNILAGLSSYIKAGLIRVVGYCYLQNSKIEYFLMKKGCTEILNPSLNSKGLTYKIDQWIKTVTQAHKKANLVDETKVRKSISAQKNEEANWNKGSDFRLVWTEPLPIGIDCWIAQGSQCIKKNYNFYSIEFFGPPPSYGMWRERLKNVWQYVPSEKSDKTEFISDEGSWLFFGNRPEFSWETYTWFFSSDNPILKFKNSKGEFERVRQDKEQIQFCKNSPDAVEIMRKIMLHLKAEVHFRSSHPNFKKMTDFKIENVSYSNRGMLFKDESESTDYSGKFTKGDEPQWNQGDLSEKRKERDFAVMESEIDATLSDEEVDWLDRLKSVGLKVKVAPTDSTESVDVVFLDMFDDLLICKTLLPTKIMGNDHQIHIEINKKNEVVFESVGVTLEEWEKQEDETVIVTFNITKLSEHFREMFYDIFENRQEDVSTFLKLAKGM